MKKLLSVLLSIIRYNFTINTNENIQNHSLISMNQNINYKNIHLFDVLFGFSQ